MGTIALFLHCPRRALQAQFCVLLGIVLSIVSSIAFRILLSIVFWTLFIRV